MIKKITLLTLLILSATLFSQGKIKGNGNVTIIKTALKPFNKITIRNDFKVVLIKSNTNAIEIETDENLHEAISFNVSDSTFLLQTANKIKPKKALNITIFCTDILKEINLNDDSEIETLNTINLSEMTLVINDYSKANIGVKSDNFDLVNNNKSKIQLRSKSKLNIDSPKARLSIGGSSNSFITIKSDSLQIDLKERGAIEIEGSANVLNVTAKENSDFEGSNLNVKETNITVKGNSELSIQAIETITLESSDKSKVEVYGNAKIILNKFTNASKLHKKELNSK